MIRQLVEDKEEEKAAVVEDRWARSFGGGLAWLEAEERVLYKRPRAPLSFMFRLVATGTVEQGRSLCQTKYQQRLITGYLSCACVRRWAVAALVSSSQHPAMSLPQAR